MTKPSKLVGLLVIFGPERVIAQQEFLKNFLITSKFEKIHEYIKRLYKIKFTPIKFSCASKNVYPKNLKLGRCIWNL